MTELTPELLLRAYAVGIFPMADSRTSSQLYWLDPEWRGVIPLDDFHVPRRLRRTIRRRPFDVRVNGAFADVIAACAERRTGRPESWINDDIERLYVSLHELGLAHSVECWRDGKLVGGLYGVSLGAAFFGESMFSRETDASKAALVHLVARLRQGGYRLLDTQFLTPHLARFGGIEISRREYRRRLAEALAYRAVFPAALPGDDALAALQSSRLTS